MTERSQSWPQLARGGCTWVELLSQRSQAQPDQIAFTFLQDGEVESARWSYRDLDQRSRAIAAQLQALGLSGQRALLLYPAGLDYVAAFFGCLYAGVIAVPAYPPQNARKTPRIQAIAQDAEAAIALTTAATLPKLQTLMGQTLQAQPLRWLATDTLDPVLADGWQMPDINGDTLAFLQYTSGSTGNPKGVMLSHRNLLHNAMATYQMMGHTASSCFVSWLPLYHDMGLIGGILQPLYGGFPCVLMSPVSFLQRPYRWLKAISDYRATTSGAPDFAYDLCVEKISPEQRQTLDLSSWQVAFNGAEPIRAQTLERFTTAFSPWGFRPEAHYPCYGLAEGSLMVSGSTVAQPPMVQAFQAADLDRGWITPAASAEPSPLQSKAQALVSCGQSLLDQQIAIAQPETLTRCAEAEVGEIWVSSPSVGQGYWQNPQATADTFQAYLKDSGAGPFLRTGDLGFLHQGELFVTGRLKDLIILRGRNLYPQDLEHTAEASHSALRSGGCAAFTMPVEDAEGLVAERLVIVQELEFRQQPDLDGAIAAIRQAIAATHEVEVYAVALIKPGSIAKTTSGKIQRRACRQAYLSDQLSLVTCSVLAAPMASDFPVSRLAPLSAEHLRRANTQDRSSLLAAHLQQAIAQALQCAPEQVQPHTPLTHLGLDSLRVMALKEQIEADWGGEIAIADFFEDITPEHLAQRILGHISRQAPEVERATLAPAQPEAQLTPSQTQIFFLQQLQPQSPAYNIAIALDFSGSLNIEALRQSLQILADRHSALRSRVVLHAGQPILTTAPTIELPWSEVDLRAGPPDQRQAEVQQLTQAIARQPFDLCQGPLFRLLLCQLAPSRQRLVMVVHHLIFDGRSAKIFFQELTAQYQACRAGMTTPGLPESIPSHLPARQPWQHQLDYWRQQLSGELPILQLPTDYPRPALQTFEGARVPFTLDAALVAPLKVLAQQEKATLFIVLLAAFKAWLYRYTGQGDLLVGSALAQPGQGQAIGCSINTLALRTQPDGSMRFREFLHQVRRVALAAYSHGAVPFQTLVETLQPQRDPSYSPLVQVMFDFQSLPTRLDWPDLTVELAEIGTGTAKFDLTLSLIETEQGLQGHWEYNTALFAPATLERMMAHFQRLLAGLGADPDQSLAALPLLSAAERQQLLRDWNQTAAPIPNRPFQRLFEEQVERTPAAIALRYGEQQLTYGELNQRANRLAHYLQTLGLGAEQRVGVCLPRSPELLVSLLAILKAGGAYVPLDPSYPPERLAFMVQDSQIQVLITQSDIDLGLAADWRPQVLELDIQAVAIAQQPTTNLDSTATLDQLAYVIYTSGSTGQPKGVMVEQRGLVNYLTWCQRAYPLAAGQGAPVQSSISFDMTITSLFSPLVAGQTVDLLPEDWGLDALATGLRRRPNASLVKITPAQLELLSHQLADDELAGRTQAFIIGGENLSAEQVNRWRDRAPETHLVNEYGPTETVVGCCVHTVTPEEPRSGSIPIGRPIINTQLYILDAQRQPVPVGVVGELYIGGAGVARGYWHRPDLMAERFIANPFATGPETSDRLYKTGDLARYRPDGVIEYLGRLDHQVKIRGYRVELGEIEAALTQHAAVRDAVVVARGDGPEPPRLVAYVVGTVESPSAARPEPSALLQPMELRNWLRQRLPDYMVPGAFVVLDQLPLTVNGKVDRQALPAPSHDRPELGQRYMAPQAELERAIAGIWQSVLKLDRVGLQDNFFDLGGHSLLLVQVQSQLQTQLNRTVSIVDLFRHPTVQAIAAHLEQPAEALVTTAQTQANRQKVALQRRRLHVQPGGHHD